MSGPRNVRLIDDGAPNTGKYMYWICIPHLTWTLDSFVWQPRVDTSQQANSKGTLWVSISSTWLFLISNSQQLRVAMDGLHPLSHTSYPRATQCVLTQMNIHTPWLSHCHPMDRTIAGCHQARCPVMNSHLCHHLTATPCLKHPLTLVPMLTRQTIAKDGLPPCCRCRDCPVSRCVELLIVVLILDSLTLAYVGLY